MKVGAGDSVTFSPDDEEQPQICSVIMTQVPFNPWITQSPLHCFSFSGCVIQPLPLVVVDPPKINFISFVSNVVLLFKLNRFNCFMILILIVNNTCITGDLKF